MPQDTVKSQALDQYMPHIELISEAFEIPQLKKKRRIWALLPFDYHASHKSYPVLYLQDAQNLFDESAPFGNWAIDRRLASLSARGQGGVIVICVDHGGTERITEYSPYHHRKFGKGQGKKYARFLIETLKPYVDKTFRTKSGRRYSGIGGSSMGGLISAYTGIVHPEYFSRLMIFSPSFWYSDEIYFDAFNYKYILPMKIYLYAGENESRYMTEHIHRFREAVKTSVFENPLTTFRVEINSDGEHNEWYWGEEFEKAVPWLFFK